VGNWQRTNNQLGKQTFEHWIKKSNSVYSGLGFTLQGQDTVFKENLRRFLRYKVIPHNTILSFLKFCIHSGLT